jgi:hypothetical protein
MFFSSKARREKTARSTELRAELKERARSIFGLGEDDAVSISEIACPDGCCVPIETIMLIMRRGEKTRAVKIGKPMVDLSDVDLLALAVSSRQ